LAQAQRHHRRREPAFYVVNAIRQDDGTWALPLPAPALLAWAWPCGEVEVCHCEMKSDAGVGVARAIRAADKLHDASAAFGVAEGLSDEEMEQLSAARPGRLPWQR